MAKYFMAEGAGAAGVLVPDGAKWATNAAEPTFFNDPPEGMEVKEESTVSGKKVTRTLNGVPVCQVG